MGKVWVLDTETKGTGAEMVPLERVLNRSAPSRERVSVIRRDRDRPIDDSAPAEPKSIEPRRFKVVDLMTRRTLAEGADARATVELLRRFRSLVDVRLYVWEPGGEGWRPLTLGEARALWRFRSA